MEGSGNVDARAPTVSQVDAEAPRRHSARSGGKVPEAARTVPYDGSPFEVIVVANRTGGQGKTTVSQMLLSMYPEAQPFSADAQDAPDGKSKLGRIMGDRKVHELGVGWSLEQTQKGLEENSAFWDEFGALLAQVADKGEVAVVDLGANVVDSLVAWGGSFDSASLFCERRIVAGRKPIVFTFVVPMVSSPQAMSDAKAIAAELAAGGGLPVSRVVFVRNEWQGAIPQGFDPMPADPGAVKWSTCSIAKCDSSLLKIFELKEKAIGSIVGMDDDVLSKEFALNFIQAARSGDRMRTWLSTSIASLMKAGLPVHHSRVGRGVDDVEGAGVQMPE